MASQAREAAAREAAWIGEGPYDEVNCNGSGDPPAVKPVVIRTEAIQAGRANPLEPRQSGRRPPAAPTGGPPAPAPAYLSLATGP